MIAPAVLLALVLFLVAEALILWLGQLHKARAEAAYWEQRNNRPDLYDWAKELDL